MTKLRNYVPALRYGAKIYPEDLSMAAGLPSVGNIWYVDGTNGSDTANSGTSSDDAFATVYKAHSAATANQNDVVLVLGGGTTSGGSTVETLAIVWSKSFTHLIGVASPVGIAGRARIVDNSTAGVSPFFTLSGNGCIFSNVQIGTFKASGTICFELTGSRNYFDSVHFAGIGEAATAGANAAARSLRINGGGENLFVNSIVGLDTVARSTTNTELEVIAASARNRFVNCEFHAYASNAGHLFISVGASGLDRQLELDRCTFVNPIGAAATTMTYAFSVNAAPGGSIIMRDPLKVGATGWASSLTNIYALGSSSNATYAQGIGYAVNPS